MAERAIGINIKFQDTIADRFTDIESLLIGRDTDAVSVVKIVRDLDPIFRTRSQIKDLYVTVVKDPNDPKAAGCIVKIPNVQ